MSLTIQLGCTKSTKYGNMHFHRPDWMNFVKFTSESATWRFVKSGVILSDACISGRRSTATTASISASTPFTPFLHFRRRPRNDSSRSSRAQIKRFAPPTWNVDDSLTNLSPSQRAYRAPSSETWHYAWSLNVVHAFFAATLVLPLCPGGYFLIHRYSKALDSRRPHRIPMFTDSRVDGVTNRKMHLHLLYQMQKHPRSGQGSHFQQKYHVCIFRIMTLSEL